MPSHNPFFLIGTGTAGADIAVTSAADIYTFTIPCKCRPLRSGFTVGTTVSASDAPVIAFDRRPTAGSDTSRGAGDVGEVTLTTTSAQGQVYYEDNDGGTNWTTTLLNEGDQVVVQVTTASDSTGGGGPWLMLEYIPEVAGNNTVMNET